MLGGVLFIGPEMAVAAEAVSAAGYTIAGISNITLGSVALAVGQPLPSEIYEAGAHPLDYALSSLDPAVKEMLTYCGALEEIKDLLTGNGLERLTTVAELLDRALGTTDTAKGDGTGGPSSTDNNPAGTDDEDDINN
jgi:hypothetical protein